MLSARYRLPKILRRRVTIILTAFMWAVKRSTWLDYFFLFVDEKLATNTLLLISLVLSLYCLLSFYDVLNYRAIHARWGQPLLEVK